MATHTGIDGVIKYDSNAIGELTSWTLDVSQDVIEDTSLGDSNRSFQTGLVSWNGSADVFFDETDTAQAAWDTDLATVTSKTLIFYPEGTTSGDTYFSGTAIIESLSRTSSVNGMVTASITFRDSGGLTKATV